jgi:large subunit ribosomal protein L30e
MARGVQDIRKDILHLIAAKKAVFGTDRAIKGMKQGKVQKVFVSSNCPARTRKSISHYCALLKIESEELPMQSSDLGALCKKPFSISVLSVRNE